MISDFVLFRLPTTLISLVEKFIHGMTVKFNSCCYRCIEMQLTLSMELCYEKSVIENKYFGQVRHNNGST